MKKACIMMIIIMVSALVGCQKTKDVNQNTQEEPTVGMANPWNNNATAQEVEDLTGAKLIVPEGAYDVAYLTLESEKLAEMNFTMDDARFSVNVKPASDFEDISGLYYEWDAEGAELNYGVMSKMVSLARASRSAADMTQAFEDDESLDEIRGDYEEYVQFSKINTTAPDYKKVDLSEIEAALPDMPDRLRNMMKMLYGLDGESRYTYEEVARAFNTTDGRVRQNESKAKCIAKKKEKRIHRSLD